MAWTQNVWRMQNVWLYLVVHLRRIHYLLKHKYWVFVACCKLKIPFLGIIHDWSKFLSVEARGYLAHSYGYGDPALWMPAWKHHVQHNKHHWGYWALEPCLTPLDRYTGPCFMPDRYVREMVADWYGAGKAKGGLGAREWYRQSEVYLSWIPKARIGQYLDILEPR